jgi:predicted ATPase
MTTAQHKRRPAATAVDSARQDRPGHVPGDSQSGTSGIGATERVTSLHSNIPLPRSLLIGRDREIAAIQHLLLQDHVGLLTLTGPGGIGKTRLALQIAANLLDHFVDGVYFVALAPICEPDQVGGAIAQALNVREAPGRPLPEILQDFLRNKQLLLVLDNFEQILAAAPLVGALVSECRRLKVLATSRAPLHLYGEQKFPVPPLALPDARQLDMLAKDPAESQSAFAAINLFCQRASTVDPDFALTAGNAADVARICIGLDGMPLAIELAAARIRLFSPRDLLARLNQRLALLTGGPQDAPARQRTLRDEIDWSYNLLAPGEQALFRRLAVFVGGFTLEVAHAVTNADRALGIDFLDGVTTLLDQNLVRSWELPGGESRFGMLETIREYGLERLETAGETEMIRHRHAEFFLSLAETIERECQDRQAQAHLTAELDNLRAVFAWSHAPSSHDAQQRTELELRLAAALSFFPFVDNHFHELRGWLVTALLCVTAPIATRAKVLWGAGLAAIVLGDYQSARSELEESVALCRTVSDQRQLAAALRELCLVAMAQGDFTAAQRYGEESVALYRSLDRQPDLAIALENLASTFAHQRNLTTARTLFEEQLALARWLDDASQRSGALVGLGWVARLQDDYATARTHFADALAIRRILGENWMIAEALDLLGEVLEQQGEWEAAGRHYREGLTIAYEVGDKGGMAQLFYHLSTLAHRQGQPTRAVHLLAFATMLRKSAGGIAYHTPTTPADWEQTGATLQAVLGGEQFAQQWGKGQAMPLQDALTYALMVEDKFDRTRG